MNQSVAIVTGAGRGIGRATVIELGRCGYRLSLVARSGHELEETARLAGNDPLAHACDVTDHAAVERAVNDTLEKFGRVDALVNCAGVAPALSVEQTTPDKWREIIDTNLSGTFYFVRACWEPMKRQHAGAIVNVSSLAARDPFPGFAAYGSAKAGVNLLGLALAREGRPHGIRVHTVAPGAVETGMLRKLFAVEQLPTEKTMDPAEVARVIAGCVTGELRHTSGEVIYLHRAP